jgi:hypothetical protein
MRVAVLARHIAAIAVLTAVSASAQQQTSPADSSDPVLALEGEASLVTVLIKPDKAADFELVLAKLKEALQKSEKPERRRQAAGWHIYKGAKPVQGNTVYIMRIEPVIPGEEYDITRLIAEVFPTEVQDLFPKYRDAFAGRAIAEMAPLMSMQDGSSVAEVKK